MGLSDILGGGSQETQVELPGYISNPAGRIGQVVEGLFKRRGPALTSEQDAALTGITNEAQGGNPLLGGSEDFLARLFGSGGLNEQQAGLAGGLTSGQFTNPSAAGYANVAGGSLSNPAASGYADAAAGGFVNPSLEGYGKVAGGSLSNQALDEARRVALGGDVGRNPYLEDTFKRAADVVGEEFRENVIPGLDRSAISQGRVGSNAYANARNNAEDSYGRNLNDLATTVFGGAYEQDRNRQSGALNTYGQLSAGDINTQLQGLAGQANLNQQGFDNRFQGLAGQASVAQQDAANRLQGLAGQANLGQQDVANRLQGAGLYQQGTGNLFGATSALPQLQDLRYDDLSRLFGVGSTRQDARYGEVGRAGAALQGLPYGQTTTRQDNPNPYTQAIGLGTSIAGTAALFSDRRLKTDIARTGTTLGGTPLYSYRYLWDDEDVLREGVMAQEAPAGAVIVTPGGWLAVDYARIT